MKKKSKMPNAVGNTKLQLQISDWNSLQGQKKLTMYKKQYIRYREINKNLQVLLLMNGKTVKKYSNIYWKTLIFQSPPIKLPHESVSWIYLIALRQFLFILWSTWPIQNLSEELFLHHVFGKVQKGNLAFFTFAKVMIVYPIMSQNCIPHEDDFQTVVTVAPIEPILSNIQIILVVTPGLFHITFLNRTKVEK